MIDKITSTTAPKDISETSLIDIVRHITVGQAWKLAGTFFAVVLAAASAGKWVEGLQRENAISAVAKLKDQEINKYLDNIKSLSNEVERINGELNVRVKEISEFQGDFSDAKQLIAFLDKYVSYLASKEDPARKIFSDHVCRLYRNSQQEEVSFTSDSLDIQGVIQSLEAAGSNPNLVIELKELRSEGLKRHLPHVSKMVDYQVEPSDEITTEKVIADVANSMSRRSGQLVKVVTFHVDGRDHSYTMPPEIADLVHNDPTCRLR